MVIEGKWGELCTGHRVRSTVIEMYEIQLKDVKKRTLLCMMMTVQSAVL